MISVTPTTGDQRTLRVAAALDPRDVDGVAAEVDLLLLEDGTWRDAIDEFAPDVVLVQSPELQLVGPTAARQLSQAPAVARWAQRTGVPSIFWSTVPASRALSHLGIAAGFDHVATADLDALIVWRSALGHDRVRLAPRGVTLSAASTDRSAPVASFATAFDPAAPPHKLYPLLQAALEHLPVLVHDLAPGDGEGVPELLLPMLASTGRQAGDLDAVARVGLHAPTDHDSPSLVDRRALELAAAGVPVVGPYSHATSVAFGAAVTATDSPTGLADAVDRALHDPDADALASARRIVEQDHTWATALHTLLEPVLGVVEPADQQPPSETRSRLLDAAAAAATLPLAEAPTTQLQDLAAWVLAVDDDEVDVVGEHGNLLVTSASEDPKDVWATNVITPDELLTGGWAGLWFESDQRGLVDLRLSFLAGADRELTTTTVHANVANSFVVPHATESVRVGLRVHGPGRARLMGARFGGEPTPTPVITRGEHLLLTNRYPDYDAPYNNMFVHKRVAGYAARGVRTDVLRYAPGAPRSVHEFEGVECTTGGRSVLHSMIESGDHRSMAVHFLTPPVWDVVEPYASKIPLKVWIHGFEVQPWWRRAFSYASEEELEHAKEATGERMEMWSRVFADERLQFVFVSQHLADQAMEDTGITLPPERYSVIHNPIDTDHFAYHEKTPEHRLKLLSIRPFATNIYANDLTVAAILELVDEPWFDDLEVTILGKGRLFHETTAPLRGLENVTVEPRFLQQDEIAQMHREHGVFLCPSRMDSHGVSRDEAMASGLVPITSDTAAIPEFVDAESGFLSPPEDHVAIADAIRTLVEDPDLYLRMSAAAAARVRRQADHRLVLDAELEALRA